eukprot:scaffold3721_cov134-Isochrysis_galbana.AAC.17
MSIFGTAWRTPCDLIWVRNPSADPAANGLNSKLAFVMYRALREGRTGKRHSYAGAGSGQEQAAVAGEHRNLSRACVPVQLVRGHAASRHSNSEPVPRRAPGRAGARDRGDVP